MVELNAKPEPVEIDLKQTAIIVVDMQNAFASKGGMFALAGYDISGATNAIEVTGRLLDASRTAGVHVTYLVMTYQSDLSDGGGPSSPNYHKELGLRMMRNRSELHGKLLVENTWDWSIVDALKPEPGDQVIKKTRYSGFCRTDLDRHLQSKGIRYLLFTGIATNVCVESTARDAYFAEYWPILIEDAMNHSGPDLTREATLWNFERVFGWVTTSADTLQILKLGGQYRPN